MPVTACRELVDRMVSESNLEGLTSPPPVEPGPVVINGNPNPDRRVSTTFRHGTECGSRRRPGERHRPEGGRQGVCPKAVSQPCVDVRVRLHSDQVRSTPTRPLTTTYARSKGSEAVWPCDQIDNRQLTLTTGGCHTAQVKEITEGQRQVFDRLNEVRAQAIEHARLARRLSVERREIVEQLLGDGFSQADIAREMGVTRQAVQKMIAAGGTAPGRDTKGAR